MKIYNGRKRKMDNHYNQQANPYMYNGYGNYGGPYNYGNNLEPQKAPNIFQQFVLSFIPTRYDRLMGVSTGSMIGFVTLLALIATVLSFTVLAVGFSPNDVKEWVEKLPDFEIRNGRLSIEEDFMYDGDGVFVYMTDDIEEFSYDDAAMIEAEGYQNILLVGRDGLSIMQDGAYQQSDFIGINISRGWFVDTLMPVMMVLIVLAYIIFFVGRVLWYFLCAAVYLLFAMLIASIMKKRLPAGALFRTAVYSKVLMFVAAALLSAFPFVHFSVPFILRAAVTVVFMGFAIAKLPERY